MLIGITAKCWTFLLHVWTTIISKLSISALVVLEPRYRTAIVRASPKIDFDRGKRDRAIGLGLEVTGFHAFYIAMLKAVAGTANQP
jgi:hypothetical protein